MSSYVVERQVKVAGTRIRTGRRRQLQARPELFAPSAQGRQGSARACVVAVPAMPVRRRHVDVAAVLAKAGIVAVFAVATLIIVASFLGFSNAPLPAGFGG